MSRQEQPARPPTSGAGSGTAAWRAYAAAVTGSAAESWASLAREEIIDLLDADAATEPAGAEVTPNPRPRRPVWMVPTDNGLVPESELRGR